MAIARLVARRLGFGLVTLFVVSVLVFVFTHALGDPATAILGPDAQQPRRLAAERAALGLDRSLLAQYVDWLRGVLTGDLGTSYANRRPVGPDLITRIESSLVLMAFAAVLALPVSLVAGVHAARRRDGVFDRLANALTLVLAAVPEFLVAIVLVQLFSLGLFQVLPAVSSVRGDTRPWDDLSGMVLPSVSLALVAIVYLVRSTRAAMIEELDSDHIEMDRLNGLPERTIVWRHALPNAAGPTVQVAALSLTYLVSGIVVVEKVFNYPGIGLALVDAIAAHDVPVVQAITLFVAALYVTVNAVADVVAVLLTPRLRTALR